MKAADKKPRKSLSAKLATGIAYLVFLLLLLEGASRAYLLVKDKIPFFAYSGNHFYRYYPDLREIERRTARENSGEVRVLMLSGSVLRNPLYDAGVVVDRMLNAGARPSSRHYRVFNAAVEAHTSLDSYYKYQRLVEKEKRHFDVVLVYHAINELRANNCPPDMFRPDYSHYAWYDEINFYHRHEGFFRAGTYTPYFMYSARRRLQQRFGGRLYVPRTHPREEWLKYGFDIKTAAPFRNNLERIAGSARRRNQKLVLATFAYYIPEGYSYSKFRSGTMKNSYMFPIELWGAPGAVKKGLDTHNGIIRSVAQEQHAALLDERAAMPQRGEYFIDICHLSPRGVPLFSWHIAQKIKEISEDTK